jgi:hypothetical protein
MDGSQHDPARRAVAAGDGARTRRDFLRAAGLGAAALAAGGAMAACADDGALAPLAPRAPRTARVGADGTITLDFSLDPDVLNYAYALEQLEAAFYTQVVANAAFTSIFPANEQRILVDLRDHEVAHRDFLRRALNGDFIPNLTPNFAAIDFADRTSVLTTARTFEDLGVAAYNGAGRYLRGAAYLTVAGKIVSVEARHAAAIRDLLSPRTGAFAPDAFDAALTPQQVIAAAAPFIVGTIAVVNA